MINNYKSLKENFGLTSSWAVWDEQDSSRIEVVEENLDELHNKVVIVGLNVSAELNKDWQNFHGGKHDRKLRKLLNKSSYRGAYMTDIIKEHPEADSAQVDLEDPKLRKVNIKKFRREMKLLGADENTLLILFGDKTRNLFFDELIFWFNNAVQCTHYSYFGLADNAYLEKTAQTLKNHYEKTCQICGTLDFKIQE